MLLGEKLTERVIGAAIEVHREIGPGLLEAIYLACMCRELNLTGMAFRKEVPLPVIYKGSRLDCGYRMDLVVEEQVLVELKSVEHILPVHEAQLLSYMKLSGLRIGLLINFNVPLLKDGIVRRVL